MINLYKKAAALIFILFPVLVLAQNQNTWHGYAIPSGYEITDSLAIDSSCKIALIRQNPEIHDFLDIYYSLLIDYRGRTKVYDSVAVSFPPITSIWLEKGENDNLDERSHDVISTSPDSVILRRSDFVLHFYGGQGYKFMYSTGVVIVDGEPFVSGIYISEHDSSLYYRKDEIQLFRVEQKAFPLEMYNYNIPEKFRDDGVVSFPNK